jgi:PAS domain S-box-containing protein
VPAAVILAIAGLRDWRARHVPRARLDARRQRDAELQVSHATSTAILEIATDSIISVDEQQRIVRFNRGAERTFGYEAQDVIGRPLGLLLPERHRALHEGLVRAFGAGGEVARMMGERRPIHGRRRSGEEFPAEASISRLVIPGGRTIYTVLLRDISARREREQDEQFLGDAGRELALSLDVRQTMQRVVSLAVPHLAEAALVVLSDPAGPVQTRASTHADGPTMRALVELADLASSAATLSWVLELAGEDGLAVIRIPDVGCPVGVPDERICELLRRVGCAELAVIATSGIAPRPTAMLLMRSGARAPFDDRALDLAVDFVARVGQALDNALLYQAAQRASGTRDDVLAIVSHDLRDPLSAIAMCARALSTNPPEDEAGRRELASAIYDASQWMHRLIADLLDVSSIESGRLHVEMQPEQVAPIVDQVCQMHEPAAVDRGIVLTTDLPRELPWVTCDRTRIVQVLSNVVGNAVKFTEAGGTVRIDAVADDLDVTISVSDTGPGIAPDDLPEVFTRFWRARQVRRTSGSGLGLSIADGIVRAHGGRMTVSSVLGEGSTFRFTLPIAASSTADDDAVAPDL